MKKSVRIISMFMLVAMLLSFVACTKPVEPDGTKEPETTQDQPATTQQSESTEPPTDTQGNTVAEGLELDPNGFIKDRLPEGLKFSGKTVNFLAWDGQKYEEFSVPELTNDPVSDAIYSRNVTVKERLGVDLSFTKTNGGSSDYTAFSNQVKAEIEAGDSYTYDMIAAYSRTTAMCAYNGYTRDLLSTKYFDADMPWWPSNLKDQTAFNGRLYFCSGDISLSLFHNLNIVYVNKDLAKKYGTSCEDIYKMVEDKEWTLDKMIALTEGVYEDRDGDNVKSDGDLYGFMACNTQSQPLVWGCGIVGIEFDGTKMATSPTWTGEKMQKVLEKVFGWLHESSYAKFTGATGTGNDAFKAGNLLFFANIASYTMDKDKFADVPFGVGILPLPLYDERQEDYCCVMGNAVTLYAILRTPTDADMCSAVLECMGSEGYRKVSPEVFFKAMKIKYASDDATSKMYDIIRGSAIFDNARIYSSVLDNLYTATYNGAIKANDTDWVKKMKEIDSQLAEKLADINKVFSNMK